MDFLCQNRAQLLFTCTHGDLDDEQHSKQFLPATTRGEILWIGLARDDRAVLGTSYRRHGKHQQMN